MKTKLLFLIVIHEQDFNTSKTLRSIVNFQEILKECSIFIWDNSKIPKTDINEIKRKIKKVNNIEYYFSENNTPLSQVYNYIIGNKIDAFDYITILDHDSELTENLLIELLNVISFNEHKLILPKVINNGKIVSPAKLYYFKGFYFNLISSNILKSKFLTAINSGMTIKVSFIIESNFRYDEHLKFYGTDDDFMKFFQKKCNYAYVLNSKINHTLNYFIDEPLSIKVWRFKQIMYGVIYLNKNLFFVNIITRLYVFLFSIKESIKHKSLKFIYFKWKN